MATWVLLSLGSVQCFHVSSVRTGRGWCVSDDSERPATVKLTICRWLHRIHRTGYRISTICQKSSGRSFERRKLWPEQYWHWIGTALPDAPRLTVFRTLLDRVRRLPLDGFAALLEDGPAVLILSASYLPAVAACRTIPPSCAASPQASAVREWDAPPSAPSPASTENRGGRAGPSGACAAVAHRHQC